MANAPEVKIKLTAEDAGVASAIKALGNQLQDLKKTGKDTSTSLEGLTHVFESLISAAAIYKVVEFGKEVAATNLQIERMSQRTGIGAGTLSTFAKAAESSGASTEQMQTAIGRLATNIVKFQEGSSKATSAFDALNIKQKDFKGLNSDEKIRLVTDRLGSMKDGLSKAAIAQELMGRGGQALIPTLNALSGQGFDAMTEAAKRSGQFLTEDMATDLAQAATEIAELEGVAKGVATQFEAGLIPSLTDVAEAITDNVQDRGVSAFKTLGEQAGLVLKGIVYTFETGANLIGAIFGSLLDTVEGLIKQVGNAELTVITAGSDAMHGKFRDAGQAIADGFKFGQQEASKSIDNVKGEWSAMVDLFHQNAKQLFPTDEEKAKRPKPPKGGGIDDIDDQKADKAKLAMLEARLSNELALFKAKNSAEEESNQAAYDKGIESLNAFFSKKKALQQAETAEQISVLERQRALIKAGPTGSDDEELAKQQKVAKLTNEIAIARVNGASKVQAIEDAQFKAQEAHQKTILGYQAEILKAQGRTYEAAIAQIDSEAEAVRKNLVQAGLTPDQVAAVSAQLRQLKAGTAAFTEDQKQGEDALKSLTNAKDDINRDVTAGLETQYGAEQRIAQLELQRIPDLQEIANAMKAAAITDEQKQAAKDYQRRIDDIRITAQATAAEMKKFAKDSGSAIKSDLNTFLTSTIFQARNIGQAFLGLAGAVVGSIQKIVANLLIEIATRKLLEKFTHSGGQSVGTAAAAGVAQAAPLIAASTMMTTAGGTIITAGVGLGVSAAALQAAATTLMIANSIGGAAGFAEGGFVSGPGSATSDSIPAMLSNGEFVVRAAAVRSVGLDTLAMINRGIRVPNITGISVPRFAEGGLVQGGTHQSGGMDLKLGIGLDEGLILKHLSSKAAGKVVLQHLSNNPKAAGKAISRGGR